MLWIEGLELEGEGGKTGEDLCLWKKVVDENEKKGGREERFFIYWQACRPKMLAHSMEKK